MWSTFLKRASASQASTCSLLLTKAPQDDQSLCSALTLDLCLYLTSDQQQRVLWIRAESVRRAVAPELISPSDVESYDEKARAEASSTKSVAVRELKDVNIKYVVDYAMLKALLLNLHLARPLFDAIVLDDLDVICRLDPVQTVELAAIGLDAMQCISQVGSCQSCFVCSVTIPSRYASTSRLSHLFQSRVGLVEHPLSFVCALRSLGHDGRPDANDVILLRRSNQASKGVGVPTLIWSSDIKT